MIGNRVRKAFLAAALICGATSLQAQEQEPADSLVRLLSAQSAQMIQRDGQNVRKVIGPARFLHNDTYFLCDTAFWYVDADLLKTWGNVQIMQENTVLNSDRMDYLIDRDVAQFRGALVELTDKDGDKLRTRHLDYNTKDSVAVFEGGASMRDAKGQVIESRKGTYDSKISLFTFENEVNMFSDSVFVRTQRLLYHSDLERADFEEPLDAWKDDNMLSSDTGVYDRQAETFRFFGNVHLLGETQEAWADTLYYHGASRNLEMFGNVQITDDGRHVSALGRYAFYEDSLSRVTMQYDAAAVMEVSSGKEGEAPDTLYAGADRLIYRSVPMCDIAPEDLEAARARRTESEVDPVSQYRSKAAEEAAAKAEAARRQAEEESGKAAADARLKKGPGEPSGDGPEPSGKTPEELSAGDTPAGEEEASVSAEESDEDAVETPPESPETLVDTDSVTPPQAAGTAAETPVGTVGVERADDPETSAGDDGVTPPQDPEAPADSVAAPRDSTKVGFAWALGDVRIFKSDMQARCDSLVYADMDSLARLFVDPVIWNEGTREYVADSITVVIRDSRMTKANLMSNAFITIQEQDTTYFDQISSTEMIAYFDTTSALQRFDALGGAQAVFYIEENDALATVNKVNTKMLSASFKDGQLNTIHYFDAPKSDAYPTVQLPREDRRMKGFRWTPDDRPKGREDITALELRPSQRSEYDGRTPAEFRQTGIYFPGYIDGIRREIAVRDSLAAIAPPPSEEAPDSTALAPGDSLGVGADLPGVAPDSLALTPADSLGITPPSDSTAVADSSWVDLDTALDQLQQAQKQPSKGELRRQAREARWAEKDARDAAKAEAKAAKALEKERARKRKMLSAMEAQAARDQAVLERYKARYERKAARKASKNSAKALRKAEQEIFSKKKSDLGHQPVGLDEGVDGGGDKQKDDKGGGHGADHFDALEPDAVIPTHSLEHAPKSVIKVQPDDAEPKHVEN